MGSDIELIEARNVLRVMGASGLANAAVHYGAWVGDVGAVIADVANHLAFTDAPLIALDDAKVALRHLLRAQRILGHLDGTYPTERYL